MLTHYLTPFDLLMEFFVKVDITIEITVPNINYGNICEKSDLYHSWVYKNDSMLANIRIYIKIEQ